MNFKRYLTTALILLAMVAFSVVSFAQGTVTGTVTDDAGEPAIGATVAVDGTTIGASTDVQGKYSLSIPAGEVTISISYVGFTPQKKIITVENGKTLTLDVQLAEDAIVTDELVVVGYGVQRKRDLVGSIAKIDSKDLKDVVGSSFENNLQGKVAGVQLTQTSGVAGAGSVIRIRGVSSISGNGDPLIVVDGIPITQNNFLFGENNGQNNNPLNSLNPNDIASVEILKDASAAAIYGSRAANGVILITTKRAEKGKSFWEFSTNIGSSQPTKILDVLNSEEWLQVRQEAWENDGNTGRAPLPQGLTHDDIEGVDTDWIDEVLHTGLKQDYNLAYQHGGELVRLYAGVTYTNAQSYLVGNSFQRASARVNADFNISKKFQIKVTSSLTNGLNRKLDQSWSGGLGTAQTSALPIFPITNDDGSYYNIYGNPVAQRELKKMRTREWRSINNISLVYAPIEGLAINVTGNYDYMNIGDYTFEDSIWTNFVNISKHENYQIDNYSGFGTVSYQVPFKNKDHSLGIMVGGEAQSNNTIGYYREYNYANDVLFADPETVADTSKRTNYREFESDRTLFLSVFSRLNYSYKNKYYVQATFRRDGNSKFSSDRRFGNFPAIGVGYILSEEPFLKGNKVVNYLKLKGSWGLTGNAGINWDAQYDRYTTPELNNNAGYNGEDVRYQYKLGNPDLQWEVIRTVDAGIEIGLFNDRITSEFAFYDKLSNNVAINVSLQASSGIDDLSYFQNIARIRNRGVEWSVTSNNITNNIKGDFTWTTEFNVGANRNKVLDVGTATPDALDGGFGDVRVIPGYSIQVNYVVRYSHVDQETGRPVYLDKDGNETFVYDVANDRVPAGEGLPDFFGGLRNTFTYKNFNFSFNFVYSFGGTIYDDAAKRQMGVVTDWNMRKDIFDRWQQPGDNAAYPQYTMSMLNWGGNANFWQNNHTLWMYDATYIRLRNVRLGYTFYPKKDNAKFQSINLYVSGTNLWTWAKEYRGWDPEVSRNKSTDQQRNVGGYGITYLSPPQEKTINFGLNVRF